MVKVDVSCPECDQSPVNMLDLLDGEIWICPSCGYQEITAGVDMESMKKCGRRVFVRWVGCRMRLGRSRFRAVLSSLSLGSVGYQRCLPHFFMLSYNEAHRHSALKYVTPAQRHCGEDRVILAKRDQLYRATRERRPERWSGPTRDWSPIESVTLNPAKAECEAASDKRLKAA